MDEMSTPPRFETPNDDPHGIHLRLSAQRALWGTVGPHVETIHVGYAGQTVRFVATVDAGFPADERDALSDAAGEIIADYPGGWGLDEGILVADGSMPDGWLVYQRYQAGIYRSPN
jgi:hypothetical protein